MRIVFFRRLSVAAVLVAVAALSGLGHAPGPTSSRAAEPPVSIMPLGDSITDGLAASHFCCGVPGAYRINLDAHLRAAGYAFDFVGSRTSGPQPDKDHQGHPGHRIDELHHGDDEGTHTGVSGWFAANPPQLVLLMIGTNDILQNVNVSTAPNRLSALIDRIIELRPTARVFVASIPPLVGAYASLNSKVVAYNAAVRDLVDAKAAGGRSVRFVDVYPALGPGDFGSDGVHPNRAGHDKIAKVWAGALLSSPSLARLAGADRYGTAAAISAATFSRGVPVAFVATGTNFPDALAAGPAAATSNGPVLLTRASLLPTATRAELVRLAPKRIVVLGGAGVVSDGVLAELRRYSASVGRVAGADRYATAAAISSAYFRSVPVGVAYVATGANFPDALAGGAVAGRDDGPVLLTRPTSLSEATRQELSRLRPGRIIVLGGPGVVGDAVVAELRAYAPNVSRVAGGDRYATAAAVSAASYTSASRVYIATGTAFADGLAAAPVAGRNVAPLLLTAPNHLPSATAAELRRLKPREVVVLGSTGAVSETVVDQIRALWR